MSRRGVAQWLHCGVEAISETKTKGLVLVCGASCMFFYTLDPLSQFVNFYRYV